MRLMFTITLDNRHAPDADLLQAFVSDAVRSFATRTSATADVERVRLFSDELDPLRDYETNHGNAHRRFGGNFARPGKPS